MEPSERNCGNCWCWDARAVEGTVSGRGYTVCRLRPETTLHEREDCCPEHRTADEQARLWAARDAEARFSTHELKAIEHRKEQP